MYNMQSSTSNLAGTPIIALHFSFFSKTYKSIQCYEPRQNTSNLFCKGAQEVIDNFQAYSSVEVSVSPLYQQKTNTFL